MGYRLHVCIPNIESEYKGIEELGKRYDSTWSDFDDYWFGENAEVHDLFLDSADLDKFYEDLIQIDDINVKNGSAYTLYNLEYLRDLIEYAKEHKYSVYFTSF